MLNPWELSIQQVTLHPIVTTLVRPFETSFGVEQERACVLVRVQTQGGAEGWGEVTANWEPGYSYETVHTALHVLRDFLIPRLMKAQPLHSEGKWAWLEGVRGHPLAKHALLTAILSALAVEKGISLAELIRQMSGVESSRKTVEAGVSIGIQPSIDATLSTIQGYLDEGYGRVKLKIKPGWDVEMLREVRQAFPNVKLMADANSAYTLDDASLLRQMDDLNLLMIEQPLGYDDIYEHSLLQPQLATPICLDESLHTVGDVQLAHALGACRIVNLKPQRVGGLFNSVAIHNFCYKNGMPLWVGGMLETGVGRAASLALASLPGISLPSDLSATKRYYDPDIAEPPFDLNPGTSTITVPSEIGLGVAVDMGRLAAAEARFQQLGGAW
jgi:O-succinylbenzoate synthase